MKSDIEIARSIELKKIKQVAEGIGIPREEVENYGRYIAKIPEQLIDEEKVKKSNLILVTAITATKARFVYLAMSSTSPACKRLLLVIPTCFSVRVSKMADILPK